MGMKIYILCDMEGISGIRLAREVDRLEGGADYQRGRELMMRDINAAIGGCRDGGATEVVVCDTHSGGGQLLIERMDERAIYELPTPSCMMPSLDESFAGVILLGHHARAGTLDGFLDHTMNSRRWFEYRINEKVVGEIGIEAAYAGHFGVPVIMVSGDAATAVEARGLLGADLPCAVVKWGIGRQRARCLPLGQAHELIRSAAASAMRSAGQREAFSPSVPATCRLTVYRSDMADDLACGEGVTRVNARTVEKTVDSLRDIRCW